MAVDPENDFKHGDLEFTLLRKILARLSHAATGDVTGTVTLDVSDVEIGAVEIKDATTDTRVKVTGAAPGAGDNGVVVRNIPGGTQLVDGSGVTQPVSGTVAVSNFPASQAVTGPLTDAQLRATPVPVSGTVAVTGPLTDAQLRASAVPVTGTITAVTSITNVVHVDDNAGSLTVDGTVAVSAITTPVTIASIGTPVEVEQGATNIAISKSWYVSVTDGTNVIGTVTNPFYVQQFATFAVQDTQTIADNNAFTDGSSKLFAAGFVFDEVAGTALTENDAAAARVDSKRAQVFVIEDETTRGRRVTVTAANALKVDGSAVAQPVTDNAGSLTVDNAGTFAIQDSQKVVDNAGFTDGTTPVQPAGFIFDETAGTALTENDAAAARIDSKRAQVLVLEDATTRGQRATVDATGAVKILPFVRGTFTDKSGSIATAATSQTVAASNASRNYFFFQNISPSPLWINMTTAAAQTEPSIRIDSGAVFEMSGTFISTEQINVIGATAGSLFVSKEA